MDAYLAVASQARRFVVIRDEGVREEVASWVYAGDHVRGAALVVAIVTGGKGPTAFDAGWAAQNMMLAASNDAIGSCPNGIADGERLRAALGHGEDESVATVPTFGYPARRRRDPESLTADEWSRAPTGARSRRSSPSCREPGQPRLARRSPGVDPLG